jgi:hypothetical protein
MYKIDTWQTRNDVRLRNHPHRTWLWRTTYMCAVVAYEISNACASKPGKDKTSKEIKEIMIWVIYWSVLLRRAASQSGLKSILWIFYTIALIDRTLASSSLRVHFYVISRVYTRHVASIFLYPYDPSICDADTCTFPYVRLLIEWFARRLIDQLYIITDCKTTRQSVVDGQHKYVRSGRSWKLQCPPHPP